MDSTERLIELQIGFAKKQTAISIALLVFMGVNFLLQPEAAISIYLTTVLGFGVVLLDVLFSLKKYFHSVKAIKIIKTIEIEIININGNSSVIASFKNALSTMFPP